jgi:hypothetical protein
MPQTKAVRLREKVFDVCNVAMTVTVIALSVLFFLSFQQATPVATSIGKANELNGQLLFGSCSFGTLSQSVVFRVDNSSVLIIIKIDATVLSRMNITRDDVEKGPNVDLGPTDCRTFEVQRLSSSLDASSGRYRVIRQPDQRPNEECFRWSLNRSGTFFAGFFRAGQDVIETYTVESREAIDLDSPVGITVYSASFQTVTGPSIDLNTKVNRAYDYTDILRVKLPEVQLNCQYKPFIEATSPAFALNVASILVAILCFFAQLVHFHGKYYGPVHHAYVKDEIV